MIFGSKPMPNLLYEALLNRSKLKEGIKVAWILTCQCFTSEVSAHFKMRSLSEKNELCFPHTHKRFENGLAATVGILTSRPPNFERTSTKNIFLENLKENIPPVDLWYQRSVFLFGDTDDGIRAPGRYFRGHTPTISLPGCLELVTTMRKYFSFRTDLHGTHGYTPTFLASRAPRFQMKIFLRSFWVIELCALALHIRRFSRFPWLINTLYYMQTHVHEHAAGPTFAFFCAPHFFKPSKDVFFEGIYFWVNELWALAVWTRTIFMISMIIWDNIITYNRTPMSMLSVRYLYFSVLFSFFRSQRTWFLKEHIFEWMRSEIWLSKCSWACGCI